MVISVYGVRARMLLVNGLVITNTRMIHKNSKRQFSYLLSVHTILR
jgi:hypothetical protein